MEWGKRERNWFNSFDVGLEGMLFIPSSRCNIYRDYIGIQAAIGSK